MRHLLSILLVFYALLAGAQTKGAMVVASDNVSKNGKIVNWSIGHLVTSSGKTSTQFIYPGATPAVYYLLYNEAVGALDVKCYPNPAKEFFFLELETNDFEELRWEMYNAKGDKIKVGKSDSNILKIEIATLKAATYYLNVFDQDDKRLSSAKLLKK